MSAWDSEAWRGIIDCGIIAATGAALHAIAWVHERRARVKGRRHG